MIKYNSMNLLRGIAAFGIVACHLQFSQENTTCAGWNVRALCDMNVGLFAALSGFLMWKGGKIEIWIEYARKRCARLLPTYVVWTIGYAIFGLCFDYLVRHGINPKWIEPRYLISVAFKGGISCHLWFIISLLYAQLIFKAVEIPLRRYKIFGQLLLPISAAAICYLGYNNGNWYAYYPLRLMVFMVGGCGIRAMIGERLGQARRKSAMWFGACAVAIISHYALARFVPTFIRDWLVAMPMLLAFVYLPLRGEKISRVAEHLGVTSMGVFLIHPVITAANLLWVAKVFHAPYGPAAVLTDWVISWAIAFIIAAIAIRINWMKRWLM